MKSIRVNLRVTPTNAPMLFKALDQRPPRERGEFVRQSSERGIQVGNNVFVVSPQIDSSESEKVTVQTDQHKTSSSPSIENDIKTEALEALVGSFS